MNERELRKALQRVRPPGEDEAGRRAREVVASAFAQREPVSGRRRLPVRAALVLAAVAAIAAGLLSPPGRAVLDSVREAIGVEHAQPALFSLPAPGRLLATSVGGGVWVVDRDGSKRRLGDYREASWSPFGRFVVAARRNELVALEPGGTTRWTLARPRVRFPRWGGTRTDTRIAYLSGSDLRIVAGDGTGDRLLVAGVDAVAPAWRPGADFTLVFARHGRLVAIDAETGARLWRTRPLVGLRALAWAANDALLLVRARRSLVVLDSRGRRRFDLLGADAAAPVTAAAIAPSGRAVAFVQRNGAQSRLWLIPRLRPDGSAAERVFAGRGVFSDLEWTPDGRWLLLAWPDANQWLFFRSAGIRAVSGVDDISGQFDGSFPSLAGWCCATGS